MSFIPTFGMIPVVATSYQFWYEYHTSVFAVYQCYLNINTKELPGWEDNMEAGPGQIPFY